jgi:hypothetical protein
VPPDLPSGENLVTEKKMFGGLVFLTGGHLTVASTGTG